MKKNTIVAIFALIVLCTQQACKMDDKRVTNPQDYAAYLKGGESTGLTFINGELAFWKKRLLQTPGDLTSEIKLAGLYNQRFAYTGNMADMQQSDSLYRKANELQGKFASGIYRSLAANCVTQHQFRQAQAYLDTALAKGDDKKQSLLQQFDVALELGDRAYAKALLERLDNKNDAAYLLRSAKYKDHAEGNLSGAITDMEKALDKIKADDNTAWYCWAKANLGDMYSHANRFADAYHCYIDVLAKDHHYYHALKGIAWLAFSHDKDAEAATTILTYLKQQHPVPDYDLLLSEIASYQHDEAAAHRHTQLFLTETQQPQYGDMYNKYIFDLYVNEANGGAKAMAIAQTEIRNRPTPESYYLLSRAYLKNGNPTMALQTAQLYVENKCFEPAVLYYLGVLYQQVGNKHKANDYLQQASESSVELGPLYAVQINKALNQSKY